MGETGFQCLFRFFIGHLVVGVLQAWTERPNVPLKLAEGVNKSLACRIVHRHFLGDMLGLHLGQLLAGEALLACLR